MKRLTALLVLAGSMGLAGTAAADETTFCNTIITSLPFTITTQGHYCFDRNLSTAITTGNAITINVDFVVLDLNNFKLGGGSAGLGTNANGVFADGRSNITVRNGNIRGFRTGIVIQGGSNHLIENNVLDGNTQYGTNVDTGSVVVRNNIVSNTGGSLVSGYAYGIYAWADSTASVRDNVVSNVFSPSNDSVVGIYSPGQSDHNLVKLGSSTGRRVGTAWSYNRDNTVLNATNATYAFWYAYGTIGHNFSDP
jgi:hypothetical protein